MSRLLFIAAVIIVIYLLLKSHRGQASGKGNPERTEDMVRCAYCGVHLPRSESILVGEKHYCCEAHRLAYQPPSRGGDGG